MHTTPNEFIARQCDQSGEDCELLRQAILSGQVSAHEQAGDLDQVAANHSSQKDAA